MKTWKAWIVGMFLLGTQSLGVAETVTLSGKIQDSEGLALGDLELVLTGKVQGETVQKKVTTDSEGLFSAEVSEGVWNGVPDEIALLKRGYFCVPGFVWDPDQEVPEGEITEIPGQVFEVFFPEGITLTAIPVLPELTVKERDAKTTAVTIGAAFKFPLAEQAPPEFSGTYIIERSEDLESWEAVETVFLGSLTETTFVDSAADGEGGRCYYRSRREGPLFIMDPGFSIDVEAEIPPGQ